MNIIGKYIQLIGILLLTVFVGAAAGLYFDLPGRLQSAPTKRAVGQQYTCPMHPDVVSAKPGDCPQCGMALVSASESKVHDQRGDNGENHSGCCAAKSAAQPATQMRLPPGHPPIPGWTTDAPPESEPVSTNTPAHSSH